MSLRRLGLLLALPTVVGISLSACGTEDDAAPGPPAGGSGTTAGTGGTGANAGTGGTGAVAGLDGESGAGGETGPGPGPGGAGGSAGDWAGGAGGDGPGSAGDGNEGGEGGEGGQAPVACHTDLFKFDSDPGVSPNGAMGKYLTAAPGAPADPPPPVLSSTVEWSSTEGVAAAGSGRLNATFGALGEQAQLSLYLPAGTWTCRKKLHAKFKLQTTTDLSAINGVAFNINSGPYDNTGRYSSQFTSTTGYQPDTWYPIELDFVNADYQSPLNTLPDFTDVRSIGIMVQAKKTGAAPTPVTLFVDDIWVE